MMAKLYAFIPAIDHTVKGAGEIYLLATKTG